MIAGQQLVFLLDAGTGRHARLVEVAICFLNVFLLRRSFLDHLVVLVNLRAQLQDLRRLTRGMRGFIRRRRGFLRDRHSAIFCLSTAISFFALITSG